MTASIVIAIILLFIAAISKAAMDVLQFKYNESIFSQFKNQQWWNPTISWKNKYKDQDPTKGPAFWGSTTFLVFLTDAWHCFQMIMLSAFYVIAITATTLYLNAIPLQLFQVILIDIGLFFAMKMIFGAIFETFWGDFFIN